MLKPVMGPKYEDDVEVLPDWDGTLRLGCICGWSDSRIYGSAESLATVCGEHMIAETYGMQHRSRS